MARTSPSERPLSPHLQIYKPSITMVMSILHRITGAALYFGTLLLVVFLVALASDKTSFAFAQAVYGSIFGKLVLFGYSWALFQHMLGGLRHLVWDTGAALEREIRLKLGWATGIGGLVLTVLAWAIFGLVG
jgi:succinate dehydrogenase / fumarate reductase, cytochrome b subunit